jgi:hypothetical protein
MIHASFLLLNGKWCGKTCQDVSMNVLAPLSDITGKVISNEDIFIVTEKFGGKNKPMNWKLQQQKIL